MGTHPIFESDFDCLTESVKFLSLMTSKFEKDLYDGVAERNIAKISEALGNGAENKFLDKNRWTALDLAAYEVQESFCRMILEKTSYRWDQFQQKSPFEKIMTKNMKNLKFLREGSAA